MAMGTRRLRVRLTRAGCAPCWRQKRDRAACWVGGHTGSRLEHVGRSSLLAPSDAPRCRSAAQEYPALNGETIDKARRRFAGATVCGYIRAGKAHINCNTTQKLEQGDQLVLVAPCSSGIKLLQQPWEVELVGGAAAHMLARVRGAPARGLLVCVWSGPLTLARVSCSRPSLRSVAGRSRPSTSTSTGTRTSSSTGLWCWPLTTAGWASSCTSWRSLLSTTATRRPPP
jgi:hypothetical protein